MINSEDEEGLYSLYFHNCNNYDDDDAHKQVNFTVMAWLHESQQFWLKGTLHTSVCSSFKRLALSTKMRSNVYVRQCYTKHLL